MPLLASLSLPSLTTEVRKALASINVKSVEDVLFAEQGTIAFRSGISQEGISALVLDLQKLYTATPKQANNIYWDYLNNGCIISTGSIGLDNILDGGLWGGEMTELVGQPATGKTQICMLATLTTVKQSKTVLYIDSANSFSPDRIVEMHSESGGSTTQQDISTLLERVQIRKCFNAFELIEALHDIRAHLCAKETLPFYSALKLVVIDSLGGLLSPIVGKQQQGHSLMTSVAQTIKDMATQFHIAFLVSSQNFLFLLVVMLDVDHDETTNYVVSGGESDRTNHKPALGMSWQYSPNTQVTLYHQDLASSSRRAVVTKSAHTKGGAVLYQIDAQGINSG